MSEIELAVYEALHGHYGHIAQFWQFVESKGLPVGDADEARRSLFVFLVGDEQIDSVEFA